MINCTSCNAENQDASKFCINCGERIVVETGKRSGARKPQPRGIANLEEHAEGKNPTVAGALSFLIPGVGQFYNNDMKKGGILLAGGILAGAITAGLGWLAIAAYSAYDAYQVAKGQKRLEEW